MKNKPYLVVGIPTYCEAKTISALVKIIDTSLVKYEKAFTSVIVNADNNSLDNTKQAFLSTETKASKKYMASDPDTIGKGQNVLNILRIAAQLNAKILLLFDGDNQNLSSAWVDRYIQKVIDGYDFVLPVYARKTHDGSITNHVCRPSIRYLFGLDLKQPIGGDFALSDTYIQKLAQSGFSNVPTDYGIDIFLTFNALLNNLNVTQVYLDEKIHNPSLPKLETMYVQVVDTLFSLCKASNRLLKTEQSKFKVDNASVIIDRASSEEIQSTRAYLIEYASFHYQLNREYFEKIFPHSLLSRLNDAFSARDKIQITANDWGQIIFYLYSRYSLKNKPKNKKLLSASVCLFFARHATFINETEDLSPREIEPFIAQQIDRYSNIFHEYGL